MGLTRQGFSIEATHGAQLVNESDGFAANCIEVIHRGLSSVMIDWQSLEWNEGVLAIAFPWGDPVLPDGASFLGPGISGELATNRAGTLVLGSTPDTPAALSPATIGATYPIIAEDFPFKMVLDSKLRESPLRLRILPFVDEVDSILKYLVFS